MERAVGFAPTSSEWNSKAF